MRIKVIGVQHSTTQNKTKQHDIRLHLVSWKHCSKSQAGQDPQNMGKFVFGHTWAVCKVVKLAILSTSLNDIFSVGEQCSGTTGEESAEVEAARTES